MTKTTSVPGKANRLIRETSPYLLQHAYNPVDWYPWGDEALTRAAREDRLILLSIGYSACHWCHVMERESFEDDEIAALMNQHFVNVKVDREERPDLDDIYMAATVALNHGQGGWPMTVFLTPEGEPVFAGTYFPPNDRYGRPGFATLLRKISRAWEADRSDLRRHAKSLTEHLRARTRLGPGMVVGEDELKGVLAQYAEAYDPEFGGFGSAPKFPPATGVSLLLRIHRRFGDARALDMARRTLDAMARGGMYDQVGGGFARYATDRRWLVPHFEKMLYDNALLTRAYLEGYQVTHERSFLDVATDTLDYIVREMTAPEGGFYSSTDADSEGVEGKFFVWTPEQIVDVLGEEPARWFNAYYDITPAGNWEGVSIPNRPRLLSEVAGEFNVRKPEFADAITRARRAVYEARSRRVPPALDDKILTAWNGLMISAFAEGFRLTRVVRYAEGATQAADFVLRALVTPEGRLFRTYRDGKAHLDAYLEDYAYLCEGLIDLFEAGGDQRYLTAAERFLDVVVTHFRDPESGAFYNTADDHEALLVRYREGADGATPSANATAASALARLSYHLGRDDFADAALRAIKAYGQAIAAHPRGYAKSLAVTDFLLEGPVELALVGKPGSEDLEALHRAVAMHYVPNRIVAIGDPERIDADSALPLLHGKTTVNGHAALYVCRNFACRTPVTDPDRVSEVLGEARGGGVATAITRRLVGSATATGTARYADRFTARGYRGAGSTGLTGSLVGFGGYRVDDLPGHREALVRALLAGVNVIDTSTNYTDGGSERLIGSVLSELADGGEIARDEIIVVSKIGYMQGHNLQLAKEREARGQPFTDVVKVDDGLWHCIAPDYIEDQLRRSLDRLELETLDICLLHNPEYFLEDAERRGVLTDADRDRFYDRMRRAFACLEDHVHAGALRYYGISSNTLVAPATDPVAVALERVLEAAERGGGPDHHFRVVQVPLNLFETGAVFAQGFGAKDGTTVLGEAAARNLAVLVNRPLNAFVNGRLIRLASAPVRDSTSVNVTDQLAQVAELERSLRELMGGGRPQTELARHFNWAAQLEALTAHTMGLEQWAEIEGHIVYTVNGGVAALDREFEGESRTPWTAWRDSYIKEFNGLMSAFRSWALDHTRSRNAAIDAAINQVIGPEHHDATLSQKALWTAASTPGVTCVLNGMRTSEYVDDATSIMEWEELQEWRDVYDAVARYAASLAEDNV